MPFDCRTFSLAKDAERPDENQDACRIDAPTGLAVIADGVATGIFSRRWARILVEAVLADPPDPDDAAAFAEWLAERRQAWSSGIDVDNLAWFQKPKMRQGAFSTLLWVRLVPAEQAAGMDPDAPPFRLHARAIGDSCLFRIRDGRTVETFPLVRSEQFDADPVVLGSLDLGRDHAARFRSLEADCREGDLLVLCTDAVAQWAMRLEEQGDPPQWDRYWTMSQAQWQAEVAELRSRQQMRYDDATLALLRVVEKPVAAPAEEPLSEKTVAPEPAPVGSAAPATETVLPGPPPLEPDGLVELDPHCSPPALPDWKTRLKSLSEEFVQQASEQLVRGLDQLKKATHSADEAIRKYREKLRSRDKKDK